MTRKKPKAYLGRQPKIYLSTPKPKKEVKFPWGPVKIAFLLIIIAGLVYLIFYSQYFIINKVKISGTKNEETLRIGEESKGKNLWLFDKNNLKERLLAFAEIQSVKVTRWPPQTLKIIITEKAEGIIWQTQEKKHLLDSKGSVIKEVSESNLPKVTDSKNAPVEIGKQVVTPLFVNFIKNLSLKFTTKSGLPILDITVQAETTFEIIVQTEGFKVILDTQGDVDSQLDNMVKVYQSKKEEIKEYMDLRIEGRVYYK